MIIALDEDEWFCYCANKAFASEPQFMCEESIYWWSLRDFEESVTSPNHQDHKEWLYYYIWKCEEMNVQPKPDLRVK